MKKLTVEERKASCQRHGHSWIKVSYSSHRRCSWCEEYEKQEIKKECFYHKECQGEGKHQCPKCKQWYCDECREMFLPIDSRFWVETAMMCPQCHYEVHELPKFASA